MEFKLSPLPTDIPIEHALNNISVVVRNYQGDASQHEALRCSMECIINRMKRCEELEELLRLKEAECKELRSKIDAEKSMT